MKVYKQKHSNDIFSITFDAEKQGKHLAFGSACGTNQCGKLAIQKIMNELANQERDIISGKVTFFARLSVEEKFEQEKNVTPSKGYDVLLDIGSCKSIENAYKTVCETLYLFGATTFCNALSSARAKPTISSLFLANVAQ